MQSTPLIRLVASRRAFATVLPAQGSHGHAFSRCLHTSVVATSTQTTTLDVKLSDAELDAIGDPTSVTFPSIGEHVPAGRPVASVAWEGFQRSASDELYHAVWANAQGVKCITLPFSATVVKVNRQLVDQPDSLLGPNEVPWMVRVEARTSEVPDSWLGLRG